jgi:isoaspartyl peptidase/L-asparaginase-like protein (Ntn-hydrolase superfamily)
MTPVTRRRFLRTSATSFAGGSLLASGAQAQGNSVEEQSARPPVFVSTWPFGKPANEDGLAKLRAGGSGLDAIEHGIWNAEADVNNTSVGLGGLPNAAGVVQLDACIMSGPGHRAGSVAALEGILHPISVARRVMETTRHVMLVGQDARAFALREGFPSMKLLTPASRKEWLKWKQSHASKTTSHASNHDTIAMVLLGADGNLFGGCSTSGLAFKLPGRVGDSPIIGSGLYVDNEVGAAGATGVGENVLRYCGSFLVVEFMRQGLPPQEACLETIRRIARLDPRGFDLSINFIALNKRGQFGAAGTGQGFEFAVTTESSSQVMRSPGLTAAGVGAVGGNRP